MASAMMELTESTAPNEGSTSAKQPEPAGSRSIEHEYTLSWAPVLRRLGASLLVSTYQAGKVVVVSEDEAADGYGLKLSCHNFERAMGLAVAPGLLAVGTRSLVWILRDAPTIAPQLDPPGTFDACYLTRQALFTGEIQGHELAWVGDELWMVNTLFSCLCAIDDRHSFVPRWRPGFISGYAPEDRCHLNGMAVDGAKPRFVTVFGLTDSRGGWRPGKVKGGCLIDVASGEVAASGLSMPHSPRVHQGQVWLLDSGAGRLVLVDPHDGAITTAVELPGYTRGLALAGSLAFVGLSRIRETSTFGGVPIADRREGLKCGVAIVDLMSGRLIGLLEFHSGIEEIFDVQLIPGVRSAALNGPHPDVDGQPPIWLAPSPSSQS
jgi:uncharacterized protein (TIGR03032 family)